MMYAFPFQPPVGLVTLIDAWSSKKTGKEPGRAKPEAASLPRDAAETERTPAEAVQEPLSTKKPSNWLSLKLAVRRTSRLPPGMLPACGSEGAPVWSCQAKSC